MTRNIFYPLSTKIVGSIPIASFCVYVVPYRQPLRQVNPTSKTFYQISVKMFSKLGEKRRPWAAQMPHKKKKKKDEEEKKEKPLVTRFSTAVTKSLVRLDPQPAQFHLHYFFHSCCSLLKHRASVKRFISLQFLNLRQSVALLGRGITPPQGRHLTQTQTDIQTLRGIQIHDPSVPAGEDISCLRLLGHCDRIHLHWTYLLFSFQGLSYSDPDMTFEIVLPHNSLDICSPFVIYRYSYNCAWYSYEHQMIGWLWKTNWKGFGRKQSWPILNTVQHLYERTNWNRAEIQTRDTPNTMTYDRCPLAPHSSAQCVC
jgi:hypothetical protein